MSLICLFVCLLTTKKQTNKPLLENSFLFFQQRMCKEGVTKTT